MGRGALGMPGPGYTLRAVDSRTLWGMQGFVGIRAGVVQTLSQDCVRPLVWSECVDGQVI